MFVMLKIITVFFLVVATFFSNGFFVSAQSITAPSSINAGEICSSYKKSVGVVTFIDNRLPRGVVSQEKIPVILEERDGVMVPVLDMPDIPSVRERVIKAGDTVPFVSVVKNKASLFLDDASLIVFVYKVQNGEEFLIDRFVPVKAVSLKGNEFKEFPFLWVVPADFTGGEYIFRTYVVSANAFVFHGSYFEKDASVGNLRFSVEGNAPVKKPFLIKVGQQGNANLDFVLSSRTGDVPLTFTLQSSSTIKTKVPVSITVYSGMGAGEGIVDTQERIVEVVPGEKTSVSYTLTHDDFSRYFVTVKSRDEGVVSLGHVSVVRQDPGEASISFAGIDKEALGAGSVVPYVVCLNSFGQKIATGMSLVVSLITPKGVPVTSKEFGLDGALTNVLSDSFDAHVDSQDLAFSVELKNKEKTVQRVGVGSSCAQCGEGKGEVEFPFVVVGVIVLLGITLLVYMKKRSSVQDSSVFKNEK